MAVGGGGLDGRENCFGGILRCFSEVDVRVVVKFWEPKPSYYVVLRGEAVLPRYKSCGGTLCENE